MGIRALRGLTPRQRKACALRLFDRLPLATIALRLDVKVPAVSKLVARGVAQIERNIGQPLAN